jgi:predicted RNA-binding Zn-ribbon protein involved in translation (DUF1610 family)
MIAEISSLISSTKVAYDVAKGISSLKAEVERNEAIAKILEVLITVQTHALAVQAKTQELEVEKYDLTKKLMEFEQWAEIEQQYELKEIATGIFVYSYKIVDNPTKPRHWLCPKCYQERKAHIMQLQLSGAQVKHYLCPNCKTDFFIESNSPHGYSPDSGGTWMSG